MSANRGILNAIVCSAAVRSDQELSSPFCTDEEDAAVTKGPGTSSKVQKSRSLTEMESKIKDLQSLIGHYQENEAVLVSSTNVLSSEIMGYEIQMAGLHGKITSMMDKNDALRKTCKSFSEKRGRSVPVFPRSDAEAHCEERNVLVDLKEEVCAKLQDCNSIQNTVNAKLDEVHEFYEKYYEDLELNFADKVFERDTTKELAKVKQELKNVRKNSEIKVNNLQIQLIQANKSLELLKREVKVKDDCIKCIPELVNKTNSTLLSYKKSIANQKETIEALQTELSQQTEAQRLVEMQLQAQTPTNVTLVDPFDDNDPKELLATQEKQLQELRLQKKVSDEKSRTAHLHLEKQNSTISLLQSYITSLVQRLPPSQYQPHPNPLPVRRKSQKYRSGKSSRLAPTTAVTPRSVLLSPQHARHNNTATIGNPQLLLMAAPNEHSQPAQDTMVLAPKLHLDHVPRSPPHFSKQRLPPRILDLNSSTLKTLPEAPQSTHTDLQQLTHDDQLSSKDKSQEKTERDDLPRLVAIESTASNALSFSEVRNLEGPAPFSKTA
ncbi:hypothetical protein SKDZ_04G0470 [Saccharomyces kudriavzevii ZP591]|nr:hypothetical protein SKDZ_04G0470 [Saccharomyces kudriavzevii ZP591]